MVVGLRLWWLDKVVVKLGRIWVVGLVDWMVVLVPVGKVPYRDPMALVMVLVSGCVGV